MPVAGVDYPGTWQEFRGWFATEDDCVSYLARLRWPDGFACPVWRSRGVAHGVGVVVVHVVSPQDVGDGGHDHASLQAAAVYVAGVDVVRHRAKEGGVGDGGAAQLRVRKI